MTITYSITQHDVARVITCLFSPDLTEIQDVLSAILISKAIIYVDEEE